MNINDQIIALYEKLQEKETQFEEGLIAQRIEFQYAVNKRRIKFGTAIRRHHKSLRTSIHRFLRESSIPAILTSPLVYLVVVPLIVLDLLLFFFQLICEPVYGIQKVRRSDYVVLDRHKLTYLNLIERLNCMYCGYANGLLAYARAVAGRAEVHWCPIKHALKTRGTLKQYYDYADYGDAQGFKKRRPNSKKPTIE